jgi:anti-anti-sigma factor
VSQPAELRLDEPEEGVVVARLKGEVDLSNAGLLSTELTEAIPNSALGVVLDLSGTTYLDSSGVQLVFDLADRLSGRQQRLSVAVPEDAPIRRVLSVVELESAVPITTSVDEAAAHVREAA